MVECRYSGDKKHRVLIIRVRQSFYVLYQIWDTSEWHCSGGASWRAPDASWAASTLAEARLMASTRLVEFASPLD